MIVAQVGSWAGLWLLQRLAVDCHSWWPVITSNLASSAVGRVIPGGAAAAGAMQFKMLVQAGVAPSLAGLGITVAGIVVLATLAALPVLALPPIVLGLAVPDTLSHAAFGGVALFLALLGVGALLMSGNRPVLWVGRTVQRIGRRVRRKHPPAEDLPERFLVQRNLVRRAFGSRWWEAVAGASARWVLDYVTLLTALAAVGQHPRPSLVLLAFCAAQLLAQIPLDARRARRRRGGAHGHPRPDRGPGRRGRDRDARLPARQLLARAPDRRASPGSGTAGRSARARSPSRAPCAPVPRAAIARISGPLASA